MTVPFISNLSSLRTQLSTGQLIEGMAILYELGCHMLVQYCFEGVGMLSIHLFYAAHPQFGDEH